MASLSEKLELLISVNTQGAVSQLETLAKGTEKATQSATSSLERYQSVAKKAFGAGVAGIGVGGLLTQMASGDIEASNQLKAAVEQVGQSYTDYKDRIEAAAASQAKFGHTDEEATGALTTLTLAYGDTNKALDEMQLVADLAARKNIGLADAATIVAKAHGGAGRVFKEFGIVVKQNEDGTKNYDGALTELSQKLSGQAAAAADSYGGKLRELQAKAENFASMLGQKFGPGILAGSTMLTAAGAAATGLTSILAKRAATAAAAAETEAQAVATAEAEIAAARAASVTETAALTTSEMALEAARIQSVLTGQGYASTEAQVAAMQQERAVAQAQLLLGNDALIASEEELAVATEATAATQKAATTSSLTLTAALGPIGIGAAALAGTYAVLGDKADYVTGLFGILHGGLIDTSDALSSMGVVGAGASAVVDHFSESNLHGTVSLDVLNTHLSQTTDGVSKFNTKTGDSSGPEAQKKAAKEWKEELKNLQDQAKETEKTYEDTLAAYNRLLPAEMQVAAGPDRIAGAQANVDEAAQKLAEAQAGTPADTQKQADAALALAKAQADLTEAQQKGDALGAQDAQNRIDRAQTDQADAAGSGPDPKKVAAAQRDYNDALRSAESAVNDYAQAQADMQVTQDAANGKFDTAEEKTAIYRSKLGEAADGLTGPVHDALMGYIEDLDAASRSTAFLAAVTHHLDLEVRAAHGDDTARVELNQQAKLYGTGGYDQGKGGGKGFASGGVDGPGWRMAGENGPELQYTNAMGNTRIWNAGQTKQMALGTGSGPVHNNTITIYAETADEGVDRALRNAAWRAA